MKEKKEGLKILFVSQSILPYTGAAAFVTESLVNNFSPDEMTVIGEKVMFMGKNQRDPKLPKYHYCYTNLSYKGKGKRFLNIFRWLILFPYLLIRMQWILKKNKCNYVIGTFPDNYYLCAAYLIARFNGIGFSSYFHNTYFENRPTGIHHWFASKLQPAVFKYSDYVFVMSDGMKGYYDKTYPGVNKFTPLLHTFEEYPARNKRTPVAGKDKYELVLIGTFNESNAEATTRLIDALKGDPMFHIKMFTHVPKFLLKQRGIDVESIDYRGFIAQEKFMEELQDNDVCILTHGFTGGYSRAEYETIFPTRTIQFLISDVPIFAHAPDFSFLARTLQRYDAAEVMSEQEPQKIVESMKAFVQNAERRKQVLENARKMAENYYGPNVAKNLKALLSNASRK